MGIVPEWVWFLVFVAAWFVLVRRVLPRLRVGT